jgi:hypothetical protein
VAGQIAVIAVIAFIARDRKAILTTDRGPDNADREIGHLGSEVNPGVESCKSLFFGVDLGEG